MYEMYAIFLGLHAIIIALYITISDYESKYKKINKQEQEIKDKREIFLAKWLLITYLIIIYSNKYVFIISIIISFLNKHIIKILDKKKYINNNNIDHILKILKDILFFLAIKSPKIQTIIIILLLTLIIIINFINI